MPEQAQSTMGTMQHLSNITMEGASMAAILDLLFSFLEWVGNVHYENKRQEFDAALKMQFDFQMPNGQIEIFSMAYVPNINGIKPPIYNMKPGAEPGTEEPDYNSTPVQPSSENDPEFDDLVRRNGYFIRANVWQGMKDTFTTHYAATFGYDKLSKQELRELFGVDAPKNAKGPGNDADDQTLSDVTAQQLARPATPPPRPIPAAH
jgi:hypothetical protein